MRPTTGTDVLATVLLLAAYAPEPHALAALSLLIFVGTPLYVAGMVLAVWKAHRRGVARLRRYEARLGR